MFDGLYFARGQWGGTLHFVDGSSHALQILIGIYEDAAMRTAIAKVMQLMSQYHFELKCRGAATLGRIRNLL